VPSAPAEFDFLPARSRAISGSWQTLLKIRLKFIWFAADWDQQTTESHSSLKLNADTALRPASDERTEKIIQQIKVSRSYLVGFAAFRGGITVTKLLSFEFPKFSAPVLRIEYAAPIGIYCVVKEKAEAKGARRNLGTL
jgi:hypothetical protein